MTLVRIPTELTTAATDLALAVIAVIAWLMLNRDGPEGLRGLLWRTVFVLLAITAFLGAIAHGLLLGDTAFVNIWRATYLGLSLLVAAFLLAAVRDVLGDAAARRSLLAITLVAFAAWTVFLVNPDNFLPFVIYETVAMALALAGFVWLSIRKTLPGAGWIAASIAVNIIAAAIQASETISFTLIWPFDHNGVFHLVQMPGIALLAHGLRIRA